MNKKLIKIFCHTCDHNIDVPDLHRGHAVSAITIFGNISVTKSISEFNPRKINEVLMREAVYTRDNHKCVCCGSLDDLTLDHIKPKASKGAKWYIENLQTMCGRCNRWKACKHIDFIHPESPFFWEKTRHRFAIQAFRINKVVEKPKQVVNNLTALEIEQWNIKMFGPSGIPANLKEHLEYRKGG